MGVSHTPSSDDILFPDHVVPPQHMWELEVVSFKRSLEIFIYRVL